MLMLLKKNLKITNFVPRRYFAVSIKSDVIIETNELEALIKEEAKDLCILNCSLLRGDYDPRADHVAESIIFYELSFQLGIKGSVFFDFGQVANTSSTFSYILPPQDEFIFHMKNIDVRVNDYIVCYDKSGMLSSPRAYWMFKIFGAQKVYILNGSFNKWKKENKETESGDTREAWHEKRAIPGKEEDFDFIFDDKQVVTYEILNQIMDRNEEHPDKQTQIIDARFKGIYDKGHIPTSKSLPFPEILTQEKTFKSNQELQEIFKSYGVNDPSKDEVVLTCQRGITACILDAALRLQGNKNTKVYDGSYEEYSNRKHHRV